jgi:integrase
MPKRALLRPVKVEGRIKPWKIELPSNVSTTGQRQRFFFRTKVEADDYAEVQRIRLKNHGIAYAGGVLSPSETEQAVGAFALLKPYGVSLNEVIREWIFRRDAAAASVSFESGVQQYQVMLAKKKIRGHLVSEKYQRTTRNTLAMFKVFDHLQLPEIGSTLIAEKCEPLTDHMRNKALAILSAFFSWCMQTPRHWIISNPVVSIKRESIGGGEVQTFAVPAVRKILAACVEPDLLAYHCLGFFAGIRPEELERTRWEFINLAERAIVLPSEDTNGKRVTKTGRRRVIEINDTLAVWLKHIYRMVGIQKGPIISAVNLRKRLRAVRGAAAIEWIQDGMRHTYASNWLAIHRDEHRLRANLGHKSATELWDHYHRAETQKEAAGFWAILPKMLKGASGG